jgi:hypothetical protein
MKHAIRVSLTCRMEFETQLPRHFSLSGWQNWINAVTFWTPVSYAEIFFSHVSRIRIQAEQTKHLQIPAQERQWLLCVFYILSRTQHETALWWWNNRDFEGFACFQLSCTRKKRFLYAISMYISMCLSLTSERMKGFYLYSGFKSLSVTVGCSVNMNILSPKMGALYMGPKTQNADFFKNGRTDVD